MSFIGKWSVGISKELLGIQIIDRRLIKHVDFAQTCQGCLSAFCTLFDTCAQKSLVSCNNVTEALNSDIWHKSLGHMPWPE